MAGFEIFHQDMIYGCDAPAIIRRTTARRTSGSTAPFRREPMFLFRSMLPQIIATNLAKLARFIRNDLPDFKRFSFLVVSENALRVRGWGLALGIGNSRVTLWRCSLWRSNEPIVNTESTRIRRLFFAVCSSSSIWTVVVPWKTNHAIGKTRKISGLMFYVVQLKIVSKYLTHEIIRDNRNNDSYDNRYTVEMLKFWILTVVNEK